MKDPTILISYKISGVICLFTEEKCFLRHSALLLHADFSLSSAYLQEMLTVQPQKAQVIKIVPILFRITVFIHNNCQVDSCDVIEYNTFQFFIFMKL